MANPISNQNDFVPGVDISAATSIAKTDLIQMIAGMIPAGDGTSEGIGGIIVMDSGKDYSPLSGAGTPTYWPHVNVNPRFTRYLWLDTHNIGTGVVTVRYWSGSYGTDGLPSNDNPDNWLKAVVQTTGIDGASLLNASVTLAKLKTAGLTAGNVLVVDGSSVSAESKTFLSLLQAASSVVPLSNLDTTGATGGNILTVDNSGKWAAATSANLANNFADNSVGLIKIAKGTAGNDLLRYNSTTGFWESFSPTTVASLLPTVASYTSSSISLATATAESLPFAHGFSGAIPSSLFVGLINADTVAIGGWPAGSVIPIGFFYDSNLPSVANIPLFTVAVDGTNVYITHPIFSALWTRSYTDSSLTNLFGSVSKFRYYIRATK